MMGVRAQQKEKTRRSLVEAAFSQLSAERSFASLSLREVAREAGIAPTSFYRHFRDVDELGLTMVDESGLMLRQLMRQARQRIAKGGRELKAQNYVGVIQTKSGVVVEILPKINDVNDDDGSVKTPQKYYVL